MVRTHEFPNYFFFLQNLLCLGIGSLHSTQVRAQNSNFYNNSNRVFFLISENYVYISRNDWGAILLIDERFGKSPKYKNGKETLMVMMMVISIVMMVMHDDGDDDARR